MDSNTFTFEGTLRDHPEWESNRAGADIVGRVPLGVHWVDADDGRRHVDVVPITFIPLRMTEDNYELARGLVEGDRVRVTGHVRRRFDMRYDDPEFPEGRRYSYLELSVKQVEYLRTMFVG